ncbi:MAG: 16S rRNA (cytidine(1402)-2'-O)-methyltransferase [Melioribacteraceae bacterium]|nr:16S rRNA (cytidine(1402)-2'-O)-methyltransferase [Melioribacteraceae bacterium]
MEPGKLFVVATPIGNLGDITLRAIETIRSIDFVICEDSREALKLLKHLEIEKPLFVLNARNETDSINKIIMKIGNGENCALTSDAGTPCISDPGVRLVNEAIRNQIQVVGIPGANAAILALSISGLPTDSFVFEGFIPQKKGRQKKLKELNEEKRTIVLYESVYRIEKLISELAVYMPDRFVVICRELTKMFEECLRGFPSYLLEQLSQSKIKGEFVVIIAPKFWKEKVYSES